MFSRISSTNNPVSGNLLAKIIAVFIAFILCYSSLPAANIVDVGITSDNQHDTLWVDLPSTFDIHIENDVRLGGISLGFQFWSPDGAEWEWHAVPGGWGPVGPATGLACVSVVPGSRMDPVGDVFDLTYLLVDEQNVDQLARDTISIGGIALFNYLEVGPLEHMISFNFIPHLNDVASSGEICFDTAFVPPAGNFIFADVFGHVSPPTIPWEYGSRCWPVRRPGYVEGDGDITIDPDPLYAYYAFSLDQPTFTAHLGNFTGGYIADDLIPASLTINGLITPKTATLINSFPGFTGKVWELAINTKEFIDTYPLWWDTSMEDILILGEFGDATPLGAFGQFTAIGHRSGDANGDGNVDVGDIVALINYVYRAGEPPRPWEAGDANASGAADIGDAVYLIHYVFKNGPPPTHP